MSDLLIRNLPDTVIAAIDAKAARLGISRTEYLRRRLTAEATSEAPVSGDDLRSFSDSFADLADPVIMGNAWS